MLSAGVDTPSLWHGNGKVIITGICISGIGNAGYFHPVIIAEGLGIGYSLKIVTIPTSSYQVARRR